ncbi:hypothetical protein B0T14DRAFT_565852 [Immersiella caudata]|uniref:Uncharacterized protein n=1 Tax=Immersiella caudata TaxID=314043 RepID=A0AA40BYT9_9PEZI|nr:hypothetical protein B0T14DRAFT_565852 [Immersiella caudata]
MRACKQIDHLMETAIGAMSELSTLFSSQATCYSVINDSLDALDRAVHSNATKSRHRGINRNVDSSLAKLAELKILATTFAEAILREVSFPT